MSEFRYKISVISPVYNSAQTLPELVQRILVLENAELILVNDGSRDSSDSVCKALCEKNSNLKYISLYKNFGQISAVMAGLREASGEICIIIDDDLQNPPEEIPRLIAALESGKDYVFGVSKRPKQSFARRVMSRVASFVADFLLDKPGGLYHSSFLAIRYELVRNILDYTGPYPYLAALIFRISHNGIAIEVNNEPRKHSKSNYSLIKLLKLWLNGFTGFSIVPLRVATFVGFLVSTLGFLVAASLIFERLVYGKFVAGWVSILGATLIFSGLQLLALGLMGEYIGRIFMVLNKFPQYCIREKRNCEIAQPRKS